MTIEQFSLHLLQYDISMFCARPIRHAVIRTADGDREIAAVHCDGDRLIIDLGEKEVL